MLKIEHTEVVGWEAAIRGMRNPMNSWEKSDSYFWANSEIGPNDLELMKKLRNAGTDHRKFMRMITVYVDITAPLYWWKEFDTYKVGTVANSCSTMHKIAAKEFTLEDFSHEHLKSIELSPDEGYNPLESLKSTIKWLNKGDPIVTRRVSGYVGFCDWIKALPYSELITGKDGTSDGRA